MKGVIKKLTDRGYGFIKPDGEGKDLFFHAKELVGVTYEELKEGDAVSFDISEGDKGPSAIQVKKD